MHLMRLRSYDASNVYSCENLLLNDSLELSSESASSFLLGLPQTSTAYAYMFKMLHSRVIEPHK